MALIVATLAAIGTGCGSDIVLGEEPGTIELASGRYDLAFGPQIETDCLGEYVPREGAFDALDFAAAGLVEGEIALEAGTAGVVVSGDPVELGYQTVELYLGRDMFLSADPDALVAMVPLDRDGIEDTRAQIGTLEIDPASAMDGQVQGRASVCYAPAPDLTDDHACTVTFAVTLTRCCLGNEP